MIYLIKVPFLAPLTPFIPKWLPIARNFLYILFVLIKTNVIKKVCQNWT